MDEQVRQRLTKAGPERIGLLPKIAKRSPAICEDLPCEIQFAYLSREDILISVPEISRGSKSGTVAKN